MSSIKKTYSYIGAAHDESMYAPKMVNGTQDGYYVSPCAPKTPERASKAIEIAEKFIENKEK